MPKDLLKTARKTNKAPKKSKQEMREVVVTDNEILTLIEIASLTGELAPLEKQHKSVVQERLFEMWTKEMWEGKKKPDNFKAVLKTPSGMDDCKASFIFKVRSDGLQKVFPLESDLPDDKTVQEVAIEMIVEQCGLSAANAKKFVNDEIEIAEKTTTPDSFNKMYYGDNELHNKLATLLFKYAQARPKKGEKTVRVEPFDDELEQALFVTEQEVALKDGVEERAFTYCTTLEQLRKLLTFCNVTKQVSNFEFAISDDAKTKHERHKGVVDKYLIPETAAK